MRYLTFYVRCQFRCDDGTTFSWIFEESAWVFVDAERTIVQGEVVYYTPEECIGRAVRTFFQGLTEPEREQAARNLEILANQDRARVTKA
jgi:hypothetical protein